MTDSRGRLPLLVVAALLAAAALPPTAAGNDDFGRFSDSFDSSELIVGSTEDPAGEQDLGIAKVSNLTGGILGVGRISAMTGGSEYPVGGEIANGVLWTVVELDPGGFAVVTVDAFGFQRTGPCGDGFRLFTAASGNLVATAVDLYEGYLYVAYTIDGNAFLVRIDLADCFLDEDWGGPGGIDVDPPINSGSETQELIRDVHVTGGVDAGIAVAGQVATVGFVGLFDLDGDPATGFKTNGYHVLDFGTDTYLAAVLIHNSRVYAVGAENEDMRRTLRICFDLTTGDPECDDGSGDPLFDEVFAGTQGDTVTDLLVLPNGRFVMVGYGNGQGFIGVFNDDFTKYNNCDTDGFKLFAFALSMFLWDAELAADILYLSGYAFGGSTFDMLKFAVDPETCEVIAIPFGIGGLLVDFTGSGLIGGPPAPPGGGTPAPATTLPILAPDELFRRVALRALLLRTALLQGSFIRQSLSCPPGPAGRAAALFNCFFAIQYLATLATSREADASQRRRRRRIVIARGSVTVPAGRTRRARIRLTRAGRRALSGYRGGRLRTTVRLTVRRGSRRATGANRRSLRGTRTIRIVRRPRR